jgi:hypothetical protein
VGDTATEPEVATDPTPLLIEQLDALVAVQLKVDELPDVMEEGLALKDVITGAGTIVTVA